MSRSCSLFPSIDYINATAFRLAKYCWRFFNKYIEGSSNALHLLKKLQIVRQKFILLKLAAICSGGENSSESLLGKVTNVMASWLSPLMLAKKLQHSKILKYWNRILSRFGGYSNPSNVFISSSFWARRWRLPEIRMDILENSQSTILMNDIQKLATNWMSNEKEIVGLTYRERMFGSNVVVS